MRLLWFGDMAATGFGSVTTDVGRELLKLGIDVRFVSQNDLGMVPPEPFGSRTLDLAFYEANWDPTRGDIGVTAVRDIVRELVTGTADAKLANGDAWDDWRPDACVLLGDFVACRLLVSRFRDAFRLVPTFNYAPVEGTDLPPLWDDIWSWVKPIAMSRFGQDQIEKVTGVRPPLAYHGVDTEAFHPATPSTPVVVPVHKDSGATLTLPSRDACRRYFGADPRMTWVVRTDRLMPRKRYNALLRAMAPVLERHDDVQLVIHANIFDQGGFLPDSASKLSKKVQRQIILPQWGSLPRPALNALYCASDLYVTTSAEGFGLCIGEALACGIPAVGIDYSAVPEVIGPGGKVVPIAFEYDNEYDHKWAQPDEEAFTAAVEELVERPARRRELGEAGRRHVTTSFRWAEAARVIAEACASATTEAIAA